MNEQNNPSQLLQPVLILANYLPTLQISMQEAGQQGSEKLIPPLGPGLLPHPPLLLALHPRPLQHQPLPLHPLHRLPPLLLEEEPLPRLPLHHLVPLHLQAELLLQEVPQQAAERRLPPPLVVVVAALGVPAAGRPSLLPFRRGSPGSGPGGLALHARTNVPSPLVKTTHWLHDEHRAIEGAGPVAILGSLERSHGVDHASVAEHDAECGRRGGDEAQGRPTLLPRPRKLSVLSSRCSGMQPAAVVGLWPRALAAASAETPRSSRARRRALFVVLVLVPPSARPGPAAAAAPTLSSRLPGVPRRKCIKGNAYVLAGQRGVGRRDPDLFRCVTSSIFSDYYSIMD